MRRNKLLISAEQDLRSSSIYGGFLILNALRDNERISIFDLYNILKKDNRNFTYSSTLYTLIFLFVNGLIDFDEPYIYKIGQ